MLRNMLLIQQALQAEYYWARTRMEKQQEQISSLYEERRLGVILEWVREKESEPGGCHSWDRRQRWCRMKLAGRSFKMPVHVSDFNGHSSSTAPNPFGSILLLTFLKGLPERCLCCLSLIACCSTTDAALLGCNSSCKSYLSKRAQLNVNTLSRRRSRGQCLVELFKAQITETQSSPNSQSLGITLKGFFFPSKPWSSSFPAK